MSASIRARLFAGVALIIGATGIMGGYLEFRWAFSEAIELQDAILLQVGAIVAATQSHIDLSEVDGVDREAKVVVTNLGKPIAGSTLAQLPVQTTDGLHTIKLEGDDWRVYVLTRPDATRWVVAQLTDYRDEVATDSAMRTIFPLLTLIPVILVFVAIVIRLSFRPVTLLTQQLDESSIMRWKALPSDHLPFELKPFVDAINRLIARNITLFERQQRFIGDAAHEMRSPIAALRLQTENLANVVDGPAAKDRVATLTAGFARVSRHLDQLLSHARHDAQYPVRIEAFAFSDIAKECMSDLLPMAFEKEIDIGFTRLENVKIRSDRMMLRVALRNLIENAIRYTPPHGVIDLQLFKSATEAVFSVEDTGPGIPADRLKRVFEPFYRGEETDHEGTGLGLAIVANIADSLGCTVRLTNIEGRIQGGLRAEFRCPLSIVN